MIARLVLASLAARRVTAGLSVLTIALSVFLLLGVETVRDSARAGFASTVSGTDLIVGARSGGVNLLLSSVFHIGNAENVMRWSSLETIQARPEVAWAVPISLGDNHQGYRVVGTTPDYFTRFRYGRDVALTFAAGARFTEPMGAVLGFEVAEALGYRVGQTLAVSHGVGAVSFVEHEGAFHIDGVLERTGTPVDRTVFVDQRGLGYQHNMPRDQDYPDTVTAAFLGLTSPIATLSLQRWIAEFEPEPLSAVLPGVALGELWSIVGVAEQALRVVSWLVALAAIVGLVATILSGLDARRREMAVLRAVGAGPRHLAGLLVAEAGLITLTGILLGMAALYLGFWVARDPLTELAGIALTPPVPGTHEIVTLGAILVAGLVAGLVPAWRAYRWSLSDGLLARV